MRQTSSAIARVNSSPAVQRTLGGKRLPRAVREETWGRIIHCAREIGGQVLLALNRFNDDHDLISWKVLILLGLFALLAFLDQGALDPPLKPMRLP